MMKYVKKFFNLFYPVIKDQNNQPNRAKATNGNGQRLNFSPAAEGPERIIEVQATVEAAPVVARSLDEQVRDWAALDGYMWRDKKQAWDVISARIISKVEPGVQEELIEIPKIGAETQVDRDRLEHLNAIRDRILPRVDSANKQSERLEQMGITFRGASLMVWIGWMSVTALGWVFSWMLERIVQRGQSSPPIADSSLPPTADPSLTPPAGQSVNDIIALFAASFSKLRERLIDAFPGYQGHEWIVIILGIVLVLVAILAYLQAQRLAGQFQTIESALDIATQGATTPAIDKNIGSYETSNPKTTKRKAKWLIIAVVLGLLGFGILLSAVQQGYNTISFIMLGYSLAAVTAAIMMLILHYTLRLGDRTQENQRFMPTWLYKMMVGVTFSVLMMLLISLVILTGWADDFPSALAVFSIGIFLLFGTTALAAGQIYLNIFRNENRWIGVRAQLDRRLHDLQEAIDKPIKEAQEARRKQEERKRQAAFEKARVQHEEKRMYHIFEEAYNRGKTARELQEHRLRGAALPGPRELMVGNE